MGIGSVCGDNSYYGYSAVTQNKSNDIYASASTSIGDVSSDNEQDPLTYYKKLCSEYSDVTFRLDDIAEASKYPDKLSLGYNGSMNQIGNNFGGKGNCSISIDIAVIKRMQSDPQYEQSVKGLIEDSRRRYSEFEAGALQDGYQYVSVSIEDNNGKPQRGVVQTNYPYSTEDEVKSMWSSGEYSNRVVSIVDDIKSEAADIFFKMYDESRSDSVVKDTTTGASNHEWEKNLRCQEAAESTTEDSVYEVTALTKVEHEVNLEKLRLKYPRLYEECAYVDADTGRIVVTISKAIVKDGKPVGVFAADFFTDEITAMTDELTTTGSFPILVDSAGSVLTHKKEAYRPTPDAEGEMIAKTYSEIGIKDKLFKPATRILKAPPAIFPKNSNNGAKSSLTTIMAFLTSSTHSLVSSISP